jgi:hypothetical protein
MVGNTGDFDRAAADLAIDRSCKLKSFDLKQQDKQNPRCALDFRRELLWIAGCALLRFELSHSRAGVGDRCLASRSSGAIDFGSPSRVLKDLCQRSGDGIAVDLARRNECSFLCGEARVMRLIREHRRGKCFIVRNALKPVRQRSRDRPFVDFT